MTQVLKELEFTVEACAEPFAAVKKLMGEHFDAVAVDCDNEQNATLLFRSARTSTSNQASLAIAVVEGQTGVAKAFRIGANLVLTKPINIEQAKGTLRVARGLLRKGDSAKPLAHGTTVNAPLPTVAPSAKPKSAEVESSPVASVAAAPRPAPSPTAMPQPWERVTHSSVPAAHTGIQNVAEQESMGENSARDPIAPSFDSAPASSVTASAGWSNFSAGGASAPAPARIPEEAKSEATLQSKIARVVPPMDEALERDGSRISEQVSTPVFAPIQASTDTFTLQSPIKSESQPDLQTEPKGNEEGSKKFLVIAVIIVLLAVALYFGWTLFAGKTRVASDVDAPTSVETAKWQPPASQTQTTNSALPVASSSSGAVTQPAKHESQPFRQTDPRQTDVPQKDKEDSSESAQQSVTPKTAGDAARPLVVVKTKGASSQRLTSADTTAPNVIVTSGSSAGPLPNLVTTSATTAPVLQTLSVSQGVSQGLLIKKVSPNYPMGAMRLRLEGSVQLLATVGKSGNITAVKTVSGEPLLAQAAKDAVKQWKYKPYLLNGEPVEIQTQVTINFKLPR
ncbi:MAG TPA: TonB family protein [Candidatus Sulfotelmatobacter sp.]